MIRVILPAFATISFGVYFGIFMAKINNAIYEELLINYGINIALIVSVGVPLLLISIIAYLLYRKYGTKYAEESLVDPLVLVKKVGIKSILALCVYEIVKSTLFSKKN